MDWENVPQGTPVCESKGIDKGTIVKAIARGADTVKKVSEATGACVEEKCCLEKVQSLLDATLPVLDGMKNIGGCSCDGGCGCGGSCH